MTNSHDDFVQAMREMEAACPCKGNVRYADCKNRPTQCRCLWNAICDVPPPVDIPDCEWSGHAALRKAAVAHQDDVCKAWGHHADCEVKAIEKARHKYEASVRGLMTYRGAVKIEIEEAHESCRAAILAEIFGEGK